jgi:hypothetical protein
VKLTIASLGGGIGDSVRRIDMSGQGRNIGVVADIEAMGVAVPPPFAISWRLVDVCDDEDRAFRGKPRRDAEADALRTSGHNGVSALQTTVGGFAHGGLPYATR